MEKRVILLVEDNPDDEELTLRALGDYRVGNDVFVAHDGVEALDFLFRTGPHVSPYTGALPAVTLLDLKLPRLGGLEVLRQLRADARTKLLPVVVLTSSKEEQDLIQSYSLGCNSYIRKPVDFLQFADAVRQLKLYWFVLNEAPPVGVGA